MCGFPIVIQPSQAEKNQAARLAAQAPPTPTPTTTTPTPHRPGPRGPDEEGRALGRIAPLLPPCERVGAGSKTSPIGGCGASGLMRTADENGQQPHRAAAAPL